MSNKTITVGGGCGMLTVDAESGEVLAYAPENLGPNDGGYSMVSQIDLDEWKQHWNKTELDDYIDILDVSYWDRYTNYCLADDGFREDVKSDYYRENTDSMLEAENLEPTTDTEWQRATAIGKWDCMELAGAVKADRMITRSERGGV